MNLPSVETLEATHSFPCAYTYKVIGTASDDFADRVVRHVREELHLDGDPPHSMRSTKGGRHVAITLEPHCTSAQQVLAIYARLSGLDGLFMLL